jgi:hypothetical protein
MEYIGEDEIDIQDELIGYFRKHCKATITLPNDRSSKEFSDIVESSSIWRADNYKNLMLPSNRTIYFEILSRSVHFSKRPAELKRIKGIWDGLAEVFKVVFAEDTTPAADLPFARNREAVYQHTSELLKLYVKQHGKKKVTPYWHILVVHVPDMMDRNWIRIGAWATEAKHRHLKWYSKPESNYGKQSFPRQVLEDDFLWHYDKSPPKPMSRAAL